MRGVLVLFLILGGATCSTASETNTNCEWPKSHSERVRSSSALSADAEFAEDLAIRHADACCGLGSPGFESLEQYAQARDACMAKLFQLLGQEYGVSAEQVRQALGQRRLGTDLLIMLFYGAVYAIVAYVIVRWLWRRIGQEDPSRATVISVFVSLVVALIGHDCGRDLVRWIRDGPLGERPPQLSGDSRTLDPPSARTILLRRSSFPDSYWSPMV